MLHPPVESGLFTLDHVDARGRAAALLHCLGTRPTWQGRGVASAMIAQTLVTSREAGHRRAELHVGSDNGVAGRLYTRLGFSDTGRGHAILTRQLPAD